MIYLGLLRGVNVGGGRLLKMAELKVALEKAGFENVKTYINSGNVIFVSDEKDMLKLAKGIETVIKKNFSMDVDTVVFSLPEWKKVVQSTPKWWGNEEGRKYNLLAVIKPTKPADVLKAIGELKPDIEAAEAGPGVVYQSISIKFFGRAASGKLASNPLYKRVTIRNLNTTNKLLGLMEAHE